MPQVTGAQILFCYCPCTLTEALPRQHLLLGGAKCALYICCGCDTLLQHVHQLPQPQCESVTKRYVLSIAEPPGAPAAAGGKPGPAAAAAAAPAPSRDPLEDLMEPTPSAASPQPPMPGEPQDQVHCVSGKKAFTWELLSEDA